MASIIHADAFQHWTGKARSLVAGGGLNEHLGRHDNVTWPDGGEIAVTASSSFFAKAPCACNNNRSPAAASKEPCDTASVQLSTGEQAAVVKPPSLLAKLFFEDDQIAR